jgi:hypothetical protein
MFKNFFTNHSRQAIVLLLLSYIPVAFIIIAIALQNVVPIHHLTRDPTAVMKAPMYTGILSNTGALLWCTATAICLFGYFLLRNTIHTQTKNFLLFSGILSLLLLVDDFYMLHESVIPNLIGYGEGFMFTIYGLYLMGYLFVFRNFILERTPFLLLGMACGFLGLSVLIDAANFSFLPTYDGNLWEDGTKFMGITSWVVYFSFTTYKLITEAALFNISDQEINTAQATQENIVLKPTLGNVAAMNRKIPLKKVD